MPKRLSLYCCFIVEYIQWIVWIDKWYICLYSLLETLAAGAVTDWNKTNVRGLFFECIFFFIVPIRIYWHLFNFQQMLLAESVLHHRNENCGNVFRYTIERYVHVSWKKRLNANEKWLAYRIADAFKPHEIIHTYIICIRWKSNFADCGGYCDQPSRHHTCVPPQSKFDRKRRTKSTCFFLLYFQIIKYKSNVTCSERCASQ